MWWKSIWHHQISYLAAGIWHQHFFLEGNPEMALMIKPFGNVLTKSNLHAYIATSQEKAGGRKSTLPPNWEGKQGEEGEEMAWKRKAYIYEKLSLPEKEVWCPALSALVISYSNSGGLYTGKAISLCTCLSVFHYLLPECAVSLLPLSGNGGAAGRCKFPTWRRRKERRIISYRKERRIVVICDLWRRGEKARTARAPCCILTSQRFKSTGDKLSEACVYHHLPPYGGKKHAPISSIHPHI